MRAAILTWLLLALPSCATAGPVPHARSGPYTLEVVDSHEVPLPTFEHRGRTYVLGTHGERYLIRVRNESPRRVEVVASVDGRDVVDGRPAAYERRGYVVAPWQEVTIDGFRTSGSSVAAFRFGSVADSYAARMGDARDVGIIGVAVFPEREAPPRARPLRPESKADERGRHERSDVSGAAPQAGPEAMSRRGLGTEFGEEHASHVVEVAFRRASSRPAAVLTVRYDDRAGLASLGIDVERRAWQTDDDRWLREAAEPFRRSRWAEPPPGRAGGSPIPLGD
jgi:hypothetical protein